MLTSRSIIMIRIEETLAGAWKNGPRVATGNRPLLYAGALIPVVFWGTLATCAAQFEDYSHLADLVSELGAAGTSTRGLFASGLLVCSLLSIAFTAGIRRECRRRRIDPGPAYVILAYSFSIAGAAIFPMPHPLHGILGMPAILLLLSPLSAAVLWRGLARPKGLTPFAAVSFAVMALGFLVFAPDVLAGCQGLKQRFFHAGWSIWFGYLGLGFAGHLAGGRRRRLDAVSVPERLVRRSPR